MPDNRANAIASIPPANATLRRRGTGFDGWRALTRRTAQVHHDRTTRMPSVGSGSNVQPSSRFWSVGPSVGAGPWAKTGDAGSAVVTVAPAIPRTAASHERDLRFGVIDRAVMPITRIVPRRPLTRVRRGGRHRTVRRRSALS